MMLLMRRGMVALAMIAFSATAHAQEQVAEAPTCGEDEHVVWQLSYQSLSCNCTNFVNPHEPSRNRWQFRSEPVVTGAQRGATGRTFRAGDVIVSIDGHLITTREGGRRFAQLTGGQTVLVRVRRGRDERDLIIRPEAQCVPALPGGVIAIGARPPRVVPDVVVLVPDTVIDVTRVVVTPRARPPLPPVPAIVQSSGWLGFSLRCSDCAVHILDDGREWDFSSPPEIESVEPRSPAFTAGLRSGDAITRINGIDIVTEAGGRLFGRVAPGEEITISFRRDGREGTARLTAGERRRVVREPPPDARREALQVYERAVTLAARQSDVVRFSGILGDASIRVTGGPISVTQTETEVIIVSGDITVRIRRQTGGR